MRNMQIRSFAYLIQNKKSLLKHRMYTKGLFHGMFPRPVYFPCLNYFLNEKYAN